MKNLYLRAEFRGVSAVAMAVAPALEVELAFLCSRTGSGQSFTLPDEVDGFYLSQVVGTLFRLEKEGPGNLEGFVGFGQLSPASYLTEPVREGGRPVECALWVPLSPSTISRLEGMRDGRKPRFSLELRVAGYYEQAVSTYNPPKVEAEDRGHPVPMEALAKYVRNEKVAVPFRIDRLFPQTSRGETQTIEVEKSKWVEEILPALGFGAWKVYELPVSEEAALGKVDEYVDQAARHFNAGDWKDSMGRSRDAVQALEPYLKKHANEAYSDRKGDADAKVAALVASFSGLASSMLDFQAKLFSLLSAGSHPLPPGTTVERPDAEFGLSVAMACRRYVGARMREGPVAPT